MYRSAFSLPPSWSVPVGFVSACFYWQMLYGTLVYVATFVHAKRYEGHGAGEVGLFVAGTNGIWMAGPAYGIYVCWGWVAGGRTF